MKARDTESVRQRPVEETWADPLAAAYRRWGYLQADLDGLERLKPLVHPDIDEARSSAGAESDAWWRRVYCGTITAEFMHLADRERAMWVAASMR